MGRKYSSKTFWCLPLNETRNSWGSEELLGLGLKGPLFPEQKGPLFLAKGSTLLAKIEAACFLGSIAVKIAHLGSHYVTVHENYH